MHMALERQGPAEKISKKAAALLEKYKQCLPVNLDELIEKLKNMDPVPSVLALYDDQT